jgi:hypothetical protein
VISAARNCSDLISVDFCNTTVRDGAVDALLKHCPMLNQLFMWDCDRLTDVAVDYVKHRGAHLTYVEVNGVRVTGDGIARIRK